MVKKIIAIASSTGGPRALNEIIPKLPGKFSAAVLIIQHMPKNFTKFLADRLKQISKIRVCETTDNEEIKEGCVYIAKSGYHTRIKNINNIKYIKLTKEPPVNNVRPSADITFTDLAEVYGKNTIAVILSGMGEDGANGAYLIKEKGGYIITQDKETSAIFGMPKAVIDRKIADSILPLDKIVDKLIEQVSGLET